ncbi:MAG TPA: peptide deformylase [Gemmatimonadales bacterium]
MTIHRIRLLGDPALYTRCETIARPRSAAVRVVVDDLRETLRDAQSRFGMGRAISAPQIGAPVRIVYAEMGRPLTLINPEIVEVGSEDFPVWDDCYSFPNLFVRVLRAYRIRIRYQDGKGETHEVDLERDMAELLQHEIDHLDGVLAVDRQHGPHPLALREEWNRMYTEAHRYGAPEPRVAQVGPMSGALL